MRSLAVAYMLLESTLYMFVLPVSLYLTHRGYTINFAGREKEVVGSAVVEILQPLCVFYLFVTLLISMSFMNIDQ